MSVLERHDFINIVTDVVFALKGGMYAIYLNGVFPNKSVILLQLHVFVGQVGDTWVDVSNGAFTGNLFTTIALPPGEYRLHLGTVTKVSSSITRIPAE